jgi:hypothetical protein
VKVFVILRKGPEQGADFHVAGVYARSEDAIKARTRGMGKPGTQVIVEGHDVIEPYTAPLDKG